MKSDEFLEKCREYENIINMSGVILASYDGVGNSYDLTSIDVAVFAAVLAEKDLSVFEKAIMLYGSIHAPCGLESLKKQGGDDLK